LGREIGFDWLWLRLKNEDFALLILIDDAVWLSFAFEVD
jgi:hypothetical protein